MTQVTDAWNPAHFGEVPFQAEESGQLTIFYDTSDEPPEPDDFASIDEYEKAWEEWQNLHPDNSIVQPFWRCKHGLHPLNSTFAMDDEDDRFIRCDVLPIQEQISFCEQRIASQQARIEDLMQNCHNPKLRKTAIKNANSVILEENERIKELFAKRFDIKVGNSYNCTHLLINGQFIEKREGREMKFQFSATNAIAEQIAQLQAQLNQLTASLKPYQECEQKAEELRLETLEHAANMREKGIQQDDIFRWAKSLFESVAGEELNLGEAAAIAAQNEEIHKLKNELAIAQKQRDQALTDRMEALLENTTTLRDDYQDQLNALKEQNASLVAKVQELEALTDDMDAQLAEQQLMGEIRYSDDEEDIKSEPSTKQISLAVGDIVQQEGIVGTVVYTPHPLPFEPLEPANNQSSSDEIKAQNRGRQFMEGIKSKVEVNNITWQDIVDVCQGSNECFREILLSAKTKPQKGLIEKLPQLASDYISETGTDLDWTGETFKSKVEALMEAKKSLQCHSSDTEIAA